MFARSTAWRHGEGHEHVRGLQVPVGEPRRPEQLHELHPLVDDRVVGLGVAERRRVREELGDEHVLAVRGELHDAVGGRDADPDVAQQTQRVVLVEREPAHRPERDLVLELPVHDRAPDLVPAVRAQVSGGVDLAEQVPVELGHAHPERARPARARQPERLDLGHREAELVADRRDDCLAPRAPEIQVRGLPAVRVGHGEDVLRDEERERESHRDPPQQHRVHRVDRVVRRKEQPRQHDQARERERTRLREPAGPTGRGQHHGRPEQRHRERGHRQRWEARRRVARQDRHALGRRPLDGQDRVQEVDHDVERQERDQVAPPGEERRDDEE
jgi:hypothetical protein